MFNLLPTVMISLLVFHFYPWGGELNFTDSNDIHYKFTGKERDSGDRIIIKR